MLGRHILNQLSASSCVRLPLLGLRPRSPDVNLIGAHQRTGWVIAA
jgi:hypothetical protein